MEKTFTKKVKEEVEKHVEKNEVIDLSKASFDKVLVKKDLRKKFLKYGIVYDPNTGHHLEYNFNNLDYANMTIKELSIYDISGKLSITSKKRYIVYIVDSATIMRLLKLLGASNSLKEYEKIYDYKKKVVITNRKVNFETANIKKSVNAAYSQLEVIELLLKKKKMSELDDNIKEVIRARKKYKTASMPELAEKMDISKSALNHRFIKIRKMIGREN